MQNEKQPETRREACEREAHELQAHAMRLGQIAIRIQQRDPVGAEDFTPELVESLTMGVGALIANAEEWRARARRCAR
jgi:hypothetical protein